MTRIAILGAGGKMGCRIIERMNGRPEYQLACVEASDAGAERVRERGLSIMPQAEAVRGASAVVLAVPDIRIGAVSRDLVPLLAPGTMVIALDPAAAYAGVIPLRDELSYFVTHPCHPPLFNTEIDPACQKDWFGGLGLATQDIVCALFAGREEHYRLGEGLARLFFAPVRNAYRVTVEQMAILEPALVESFTATCVALMREALERAVALGVPREAALAFLMGHVRIQFAVLFGFAGFPFSDGARLALEKARSVIFQPDCLDKIMDLRAVRRSVEEITGALKGE